MAAIQVRGANSTLRGGDPLREQPFVRGKPVRRPLTGAAVAPAARATYR